MCVREGVVGVGGMVTGVTWMYETTWSMRLLYHTTSFPLEECCKRFYRSAVSVLEIDFWSARIIIYIHL